MYNINFLINLYSITRYLCIFLRKAIISSPYVGGARKLIQRELVQIVTKLRNFITNLIEIFFFVEFIAFISVVDVLIYLKLLKELY